ncbi:MULTISPECIES: hypothetical protein [unclassified Lysinibacillus]|uniref:hypothetical protein n=1 Tax=unclassified Lysinibacillus TaxID=2636778 RepID=UPI0020134C82|nr:MULTISPECIES: hypothetical protein [unclassified Lysinibacillus]MCL1697475.1 hypothetical protein [Lysinibacillus sp. BPa_S21]MCL1699874.1 hypothetical protein [Lysinibacillus sp. Bpr_S20]
MWKMSFLTVILFSALFLGGCNWGNRAVETRPVENVKHDVRRGVEKVEERNDVYNRDVNGVNRNTVLPEATTPGTTAPRTTTPGTTTVPGTTTPGTNADINSTNGYNNVPNANGVVKEKVVEEKVTR